ncbi:MAG: GNAT family N-acetyltransferase, partial [Deltaproteobacteria bacterium]|nr:GNAT family N-acetyltransferase [Deltaproteobacteria bacterium]
DMESSRSYLRSFKNSENLFLSICLKDNHRPIGTMTAYISKYHGTADIGLLIGDCGQWGKGFGLEAWSLLMQYLFDHYRLRKVTGGAV